MSFNPEYQHKAAKLVRITDGLSKTILISEQSGRPIWYSGSDGHNIRVPREHSGCTAQDGAWYDGEHVQVLAMPIMERQPTARLINWDNCFGLYSFHEGINATFCDGSVRFLTPDTDTEVVIAHLTRASGDQSF